MPPEMLDAIDATPVDQKLVGRGRGDLQAFSFTLEPHDDDRATPKSELRLSELASTLDLGGFTQTVRQIRELTVGDEADEYGHLRPTEYALDITMKVLRRALDAGVEYAARRDVRCPFPRGAVTTDESGGLRIEWLEDDAAVRLVIPAEDGGQSYIYHESGDDYGTVDVSGGKLASWLHLLLVE